MYFYIQLMVASLLSAIAYKWLSSKSKKILFLFWYIGLSVIVGFRECIGGDWDSYLTIFKNTGNFSEGLLLENYDLGYLFLSLFFKKIKFDIYAVNFVCAVIFISGIMAFIKCADNPYFRLFYSIPQLIIIIGMGYTRQSVAIGFLLIAFYAIKNITVRIFLIIIGSSFHYSLSLILIILIFKNVKNIIFFVLLIISIIFLNFNYLESLYENYIISNKESYGGFIRVAMILVSLFGYLSVNKSVKLKKLDSLFCNNFTLFGIVFAPLVTIFPVAIDRFMIYFLPIQVIFFCTFPNIFHSKYVRLAMHTVFLVTNFAILVIWQNFGINSHAWFPYRNILLNE
jgi:hypothetical protein